MAYTNSALAKVRILSPNHSGARKHVIDTVTIHCTAGQLTAAQIGNIFKNPARRASSNYGIGWDGSIGLYVEEKNRSWCSSSSSNDNRALTIEVSSDPKYPYAVKDKAYNALIELLVDICLRNNIKRLVWSTNKYQRMNHLRGCNMTVHRDYANKSCPGEFLYSRHFEIASKVNARLEKIRGSVSDKRPPLKVGDIVNFKGNKHYANCNSDEAKPCKAGKATITRIVEGSKHPYHLVRVMLGSSNVWGWVDERDIN